jgi:hypothetical protein
LTSGTPVDTGVAAPGGIEYTFNAVVGQHVTVAITNTNVAYLNELQMEVISPGNVSQGTVYINSNTVTNINFTPGPGEGGTTEVLITPDVSYPASTGTFALTYSTDQTGALHSGTAAKVALKYPGQHAVFTFKAVVGKHVTLAITKEALAA